MTLPRLSTPKECPCSTGQRSRSSRVPPCGWLRRCCCGRCRCSKVVAAIVLVRAATRRARHASLVQPMARAVTHPPIAKRPSSLRPVAAASRRLVTRAVNRPVAGKQRPLRGRTASAAVVRIASAIYLRTRGAPPTTLRLRRMQRIDVPNSASRCVPSRLP